MLSKAVANGHKSVAEHLMEKTDRAVLRLTDRQGRTALHYAAGLAHDHATTADNNDDEQGGSEEDMYKWLLQFGADDKQADSVSAKVPLSIYEYKINFVCF